MCSFGTVGQQTFGWNLRAWIGRTPMACKHAHNTQTLCPRRRLHGGRLLRPGECQRGCDVGGAALLHELNEREQPVASRMQFESQTAAHGQIFPDGLTECVHRTPPGHGKARGRNESRSTFV